MRVADHIVEARRERMAEYLRRNAYASLRDVCVTHRISEATARRDLVALEAEKRIVRTYGGALAEYHQRFPTFRDRLQQRKLVKKKIAAAALKLIEPGMTVYLDLGTTIHAIAEAMDRSPVAEVKVITNSLPAADLLTETAGVRVFLLGGELLSRQSALVGDVACQALGNYSIDVAFFSAEGADAGGLWNSQASLVDLQRSVLRRARRKVLCLDSTKISLRAESFLAGWNEFDLLISNAASAELNGITSIRRVRA